MKRIWIVPVLLLFFAAALRSEPGVGPLPSLTDNAFVTGSIVVKGEGVAPADRSLSAAQKKLLSLRAAKVIALREAAEIVDGVVVNGETTILGAAARSDTVRTTVQGFINGAEVIKEVYDPVSETGVVYVSIPLTGPDGLTASLVPEVVPFLSVGAGPAYGGGIGPVPGAGYDGLILDVRGHSFRPALINRIVTRDGKTLYDPATMAREVRARRGTAGYTNDVGKAKALLKERGSINPALVRADGLVRGTDVVVRPADAVAIFAANRENNFLEEALVVFVLQ
jgi:hypothetical protein